MPTRPEIVARHENTPLNLPRNNAVCKPIKPIKTEFADSIHWDELAARYLSRYDLPGWDVPCLPDAMEIWLDRLSIPLKDYLRATGLKRLQDCIDLNFDWPLRAFIGLALEMRNEGGHDDAG